MRKENRKILSSLLSFLTLGTVHTGVEGPQDRLRDM